MAVFLSISNNHWTCYTFHHQVLLTARISLTPSHPSSPEILPNYFLCLYKADVNKFLLVGQRWYVHVKGSTKERHIWVRPCFSSSVPHILIILLGCYFFEIGGKWLYSCCFVGCCFQDLFKIARSILMQFPSSFFLYAFRVHVVHPYRSKDKTTA